MSDALDPKQTIEDEILLHEREVDYDTREYPVEVLVAKLSEGKDGEPPELFVPDYQRDFVWPDRMRARLIESVLIGLPIPAIFVADTDASEGRLEIVDGSQRVRTLEEFVNGRLVLEGLSKLTKLNGKKFADLLPSRQRRFLRQTIRTIELTNKADEAIRRDLFERVNAGSLVLNEMERRRGGISGPVVTFAESLATGELFQRLAPVSEESQKRHEREELILRFFAYLEGYQAMPRTIAELVDNFAKSTNDGWTDARATTMRAEWDAMLAFVANHFPFGFRAKESHNSTRRNRFDSLAVGIALALRINPNATMTSNDWAFQTAYNNLVTSGNSGSQTTVKARIEYVRDRVLKG